MGRIASATDFKGQTECTDMEKYSVRRSISPLHIFAGILLFLAGALAGLFLSTRITYEEDPGIWPDSKFLAERAIAYPPYRLLLAEQQIQLYLEAKRGRVEADDLDLLVSLLTRELAGSADLEDSPLAFRARRLLAEVLCAEGKFDEARRRLLPVLDTPGPTGKYEKKEYLLCLRLLGALCEVSGNAEPAVRAYSAYVSEASGTMDTREVESRLQGIASLISSGSAFAPVSPDSPGIQSVLDRLLLSSGPHLLERGALPGSEREATAE